MFINREQEIESLEQMYRSGTAEFFVLYGRRRIGKTELLLQFCKNKHSIYFLASQQKEHDHLQQLKQVAQHVIDDPLLDSITFNDWETALIYFAQKSQQERLILVIDEFQYLCEDNAALPSLIQRFWDLHGKNSNLFLILCGSQVSFMEREVLAERSPLYGRRTGQLQMMPLTYQESGRFFSDYTHKEKLIVYGILGGIPAYLNRFTYRISPNSPYSQEVSKRTIEQHIKDELLTPQGYLFDEVNFLLRMELREPRSYASILQIIANGSTKLNEISQRVQMEPTKTNKYISVLRDLGMVKRITPITERAPQKSRKGLYKIADNYLNFWFRFIQPNRSLIESGNADLVYREMIEPNLPDYMGQIFEDVCHQYITRYWREKLKITPKQIGSDWGSEHEIDVLTENSDGSHWIGECKWWETPVGENVLNRLIEIASKLPVQWRENPRYILFSAGGFTPSLKERTETEDVILITLSDLFM